MSTIIITKQEALSLLRTRAAHFFQRVTAHISFPIDVEVIRDGVLYRLDLREHAQCLMLANKYERGLRRRVLCLLPLGGSMVDIGANVGVWTIPAARRLGPKGRVIAIDPNPSVVRRLEHNIGLNERHGWLAPVEVISVAVGKAPGKAELLSLDLTTNSAQASLYKPSRNGFPLQRISVSVTNLDKLVKSPIDLIKIDVEGAELDVLDGGEWLFEHYPPTYLVVEIHGENLQRTGHTPKDLISRIEHMGYRHIDSDKGYVWDENPSLDQSFFDTIAWKYYGKVRTS